MSENINEVKKEEEVKMKGYVTPKFIMITAVAAGTGLYMIGRTRGSIAGYRAGRALGRAQGYEEGIKDVGKLVNEFRQSLEGN